MNHRRSLLAGLVLVLAAGCSSFGGADVAGRDLDDAIAVVEGGDNSTSPNNDAYTPGPLEVWLARIGGFSLAPLQESLAETQARMDQEGLAMEEMIAACMAEQGFTYYIPEHPGGIIGYSPRPDDWPDPDSREWLERYGFSISTDPWAGQVAAPVDIPETIDRNQEMLATMSEAEQTAWHEALMGVEIYSQGGFEDPEAGSMIDPEHPGCYMQAWNTLNPATPDQFAALETEMRNAFASFRNDPRLTELGRAYSACLADLGHPGFADLDAVVQSLSDEWYGILGGAEIDAIVENWDYELYPDGPPPSDLPQPDPAAAAAFTEREISLALANYDCRISIRADQVEREISHDIQQRFVDQHESELEAWALHMEGLRR